MLDTFLFPKITGDTPEEQINSIVDYLIQFKETLEFALMNISTDNLSADLVQKLNELGANIEQSKTDREEELAQISTGSMITVDDVINSDSFEYALRGEVEKISFTVNFETGNLEYEYVTT